MAHVIIQRIYLQTTMYKYNSRSREYRTDGAAAVLPLVCENGNADVDATRERGK